MIKNLKKSYINISLIVGIILVLLILVTCLVSFIYMPFSPNEMDITNRFLTYDLNSAHLLGTDNFGRDILSRIIIGSRTVLAVSLSSVSIGAIVGIALGAVATLFKKIAGTVIMRVMDGVMAFPGILLAMMLITVAGRGTKGSIIAISIFMIPTFARLINSMMMDIENLLYIKAAKSYGSTNSQIFFKHFLPAMLPKLITQFSSAVGSAVMIETSLSFLGLGIQPPNASWGLMLSEARQFFLQYPYLAVAPGISIIITVLGFNLVGDGLNDLLINRRSSSNE